MRKEIVPQLDYKLLEQHSYQDVITMVQDAERNRKKEIRQALAQGKYGKILDFLKEKSTEKGQEKVFYADTIDKILRTYFEEVINEILDNPSEFAWKKEKIDWSGLFDLLYETGDIKK